MAMEEQRQNGSGLTIKLFLLFGLFPLIQACSPVEFTTGGPTVKATDTDPRANEPTCPTGQVHDGVSCIVPAAGCVRQIQVEPINGLVTIPQRDSKGTCYYVKLFTARASGAQPGDENLPVANDVIAADHDKSSYSENNLRYYSTEKNPLVLGGREFDLLMEGDWNVLISSDSAESKNLFVDNFILLEVLNPSGLALWLRGTRDIFSKPMGSSVQNPIRIGGREVRVTDTAFSGMAQGGTETVASVSITSLFQPSRRLGFKARALDCGAGKAMSDGWLLFKP